jgi:hypothetical protein
VIIYQGDKRQFLHDTFRDDIEHVLAQQFLRSTGRGVQPNEFNAWKHSLFEVGEVLQDPGIPDDMGVALEYTVPQTADRKPHRRAADNLGVRRRLGVAFLWLPTE